MKDKKELIIVSCALLLMAGCTVGVFALIGKLTLSVWLGAFCGAFLGIINFLIMTLSASKATGSAADSGDVKAGQGAMRLSLILRYVIIFGALALLAKLKVINPIAAVVPLACMPPVIIMTVYFAGKAGDK
ncbi:MAG: ATP synthase subunit I [Clostridia bacterium]|nr:ATP synthase subunit I [Clostridia bacterium]